MMAECACFHFFTPFVCASGARATWAGCGPVLGSNHRFSLAARKEPEPNC